MIKFGYTIIYVEDVAATVQFYSEVFELEIKLQIPDGSYAELNTGATTLSFASFQMGQAHLGDFTPSTAKAAPQGFEIAFTTDEVAGLYEKAINHGASALSAPETKPWGQTVAYVRDMNGILVEICSPMN